MSMTNSPLNMWVDRQQAAQRVADLTDRVGIDDLTTLEMLALIAFLEQADERVNGRSAVVLELVRQ